MSRLAAIRGMQAGDPFIGALIRGAGTLAGGLIRKVGGLVRGGGGGPRLLGPGTGIQALPITTGVGALARRALGAVIPAAAGGAAFGGIQQLLTPSGMVRRRRRTRRFSISEISSLLYALGGTRPRRRKICR